MAGLTSADVQPFVDYLQREQDTWFICKYIPTTYNTARGLLGQMHEEVHSWADLSSTPYQYFWEPAWERSKTLMTMKDWSYIRWTERVKEIAIYKKEWNWELNWEILPEIPF